MTDAGEQYEKTLKRLEYGVDRPARCCWNCACFSRQENWCSRVACDVGEEFSRTWSGKHPLSDCGVCRKWVSTAVARAYAESSSFEEARLKAAAIADGSYTEELDNALCEKQATQKMLDYMDSILRSVDETTRARFGPVPIDALPAESGLMLFRRSTSYWLVREWLKENVPVYEKAREEKKRLADAIAEDTIKDFMKRLRERGIIGKSKPKV